MGYVEEFFNKPETPRTVRVANYLFCEMCGNSKAAADEPELHTWYEDGWDFYEAILDGKGIDA